MISIFIALPEWTCPAKFRQLSTCVQYFIEPEPSDFTTASTYCQTKGGNDVQLYNTSEPYDQGK